MAGPNTDTTAAAQLRLQNLRQSLENIKVHVSEIRPLTSQYPDSEELSKMIEECIGERTQQLDKFVADTVQCRQYVAWMQDETNKLYDIVKGLQSKAADLEIRLKWYEEKVAESQNKGFNTTQSLEKIKEENELAVEYLSDLETELALTLEKVSEKKTVVKPLEDLVDERNVEIKKLEKKNKDLTRKVTQAENNLKYKRKAADEWKVNCDAWKLKLTNIKQDVEDMRKSYRRAKKNLGRKVDEVDDVYRLIQD